MGKVPDRKAGLSDLRNTYSKTGWVVQWVLRETSIKGEGRADTQHGLLASTHMHKLTQELGAAKASCVLVLHVTKSWAPPLRRRPQLIFGFVLVAGPKLGLGIH